MTKTNITKMTKRNTCDFLIKSYTYKFGFLVAKCLIVDYCMTGNMIPLKDSDRKLCSIKKRLLKKN